MTGYGRIERRYGSGKISIEIKSVNHRFFEVSAKLPNGLSFLEGEVKKIIHQKIKRGKVYLSVSCGGKEEKEECLALDKENLNFGWRLLKQVKKELRLPDPLRLENVLSIPNLITYQKKDEKIAEKTWPDIKRVLGQVLNKLVQMRRSEGKDIHTNLFCRLKIIKNKLVRISARAPVVVEKYRSKFFKKVKDITKLSKLNNDRLMQEAAIFATRCDITEEINRMNSHLGAFGKSLALREPVGRRLDFICQELFREANTMGMKANDLNITSEVIDMKTEIEKIREEVQNVE